MVAASKYFDFIKSKGRPLAEINPGSDEKALGVDEALQAVELLRDCQLPILGGDIMSNDSGQLIYAYQLWGSEYHYLNWYCDKMDNESQVEYCIRSYEVAKESINKAVEVSRQFKKDCYIVLVV